MMASGELRGRYQDETMKMEEVDVLYCRQATRLNTYSPNELHAIGVNALPCVYRHASTCSTMPHVGFMILSSKQGMNESSCLRL